MSLDFRNIGLLFGLNGLNVLLSVIYSTLIVYLFGTSAEVEAFFAASVLGTAVSRFVNTGQLVEIVVARYHRLKQEVSYEAAMSVVATLANYMVLGAFILVIALILSGTGIVNLLVPGFQSSTKVQVWQIFCITGFLMPIQIATNLYQGMLNAENIYGKVEFTATITQSINIIILYLGGNDGTVDYLVIGLVFTVVFQFLTTIYYLRQVKYRHSWKWRNPYFPLRELAKTLSATFTYMLSVQIYTFIFNAALSYLPAGSFAIYRYGELIYSKVANIFMMPLSTVFFNDINRLLHQANGHQIKDFVRQNLNFSLIICLSLLLPFWAGGDYLLWFFWGGEKFGVPEVAQVYLLLCVMFASVVWSGPYQIYRKLSVSVTRPESLYYAWSVVHILSITLGYVLIRRWGFEGVMMQVFLHTFWMSVVPALTIWYAEKEYLGFYDLLEVSKITISVVVVVFIIQALNGVWNKFSYYDKPISLLIGSGQAAVALVFFLLFTLLLKVKNMDLIRLKVLNRLNGLKTGWLNQK